MLAGCVMPATVHVAPVVETTPPVPAKPTALTGEAQSALMAAEVAVVEARNNRSLWTAALDQLALARQAAAVFDSDATLQHAREVVALCELSAKQRSAPLVKWQ
jgi:murein lipoprotein